MSVRKPFLTHIAADDTLIKIWGVDHERFTMIETFLELHGPKLLNELDPLMIPNHDLTSGKRILVFTPPSYRRGEILQYNHSVNVVLVRLIDLGNIVSVNKNQVLFFPSSSQFNRIEREPPLAIEYILLGAVKARKWTKEETEYVQRAICLPTEIIVEVLWNKPCLKVTIHDRSSTDLVSLADLLIGNGMCRGVTDEQMHIIMYRLFGSRQISGQFTVPPPMITPPIANSHLNSFPPAQSCPSNEPPMISPSGIGNSRFRSYQSQSVPAQQQTLMSPRQYDVETLTEGSRHEVFLSHVLDGMNSFTVQLKKNVEEKLQQLMAKINEIPPKPISTTLLPGTMCLGRNSQDDVLCRAVVTTVLADSANLYFVDFGHSEIVPFGEIYSIPTTFINEKVMALRFTLANLDQSALDTKEAQSIFEEFIDTDEPLLMVVTKPEMPLRQYCELFIREKGVNINVKQRILDKVKLMKPAEYKKITFKPKAVANVIITHTESPIRFFVQLELNESFMDVLATEVNDYVQKETMKNFLFEEDVNENMAVCAKFSVDNLWYRGLITDEPDSDGFVHVFFVDFGNEEKVHYNTLRIMNNEMISRFPMQAVECRLDLDAKLASKPEVVSFFLQIVEEEESYTMTVINVLPGHVLLVDLVDSRQRKVKDRLMEKFGSPMSKQLNVTPPKSSLGNWRDHSNSSNDGNYSAFHTRDEGYRSKNVTGADELDKSGSGNQNFWNKNNDFPQNNGYSSEKRNFPRGVANYHQPSDDLSTNDRNVYGNNRDFKRREDDRRPYGKRDNNDWNTGGNRDDANGKSSFKRRNDDDWNSRDDRNPPVRHNYDRNSRDNRGAPDTDDRRGGGGFRKNDEWNSNRGSDDRRQHNKQDEFSSQSKTAEWNTRNDEWATSKPRSRNDEWTTNKPRSRNDEWNGKPKFDNDRNCGGFQRKNDSNDGNRKWGSHGDNFSSPSVQFLEEYEKGAQFIEALFEPGHQLNVIVSWFLQPVHFFVKPANDEEFRKLMESIQSDYPRRKLANVSSLSANDCVVTRYTDNVIYRAKVIRNRPGAVLVNFVDYGNVDVAKQGQVWIISPEHCTIPSQSVCCSLRNIVGTGEGGQWPKNVNFDNYFGKNQYTVSLIECQGESLSKTWSVDLVDENKQNIADLLVADGIAMKMNCLNNEDLYDLNLFRGQILSVFLGFVESSKKFFVHVEPPKAQLIQLSIAKLTEDINILKTLPVEKIKKGEFCIAPAEDELYYRALIVSVDESAELAQVVYVDYGDNREISFNSMKILPDELMIYNPQIVECALYEGESFTDDTAFEEAILEKDFIIKVMDVVNDKLLVNVYDINGVRLPYPVESDESVHVLCPLPILRRFEKVNVTHIAAKTVYVQRSSDESCIDELCNQLKEKYDAETLDKVELETNTFYAAKSAKFEAWYRCKLLVPGATNVFYIDYGNTEPIEELLSVKPLDKKFFESPAFAVGVETDVKFTTGNLSPLIDALSEVTFDATFERKCDTDNEWIADLKCAKTGKTLAQFAAELNCGELSSEREPQPEPYSAFSDWSSNESRQVAVVHINSPTSFYVHRVEDAEKIASMNESLQSALMRVFPMVEPLKGIGAVRAIDDTKWYRAHIFDDGKQAVAVDFGITFTKFVAKKLPTKFLDQSNYTVECALNIDPIGDVWTPNTVDRMKELVLDANNATVKLELIRDNKRWVEFKIENTNIADMLVNENLAILKRFTVSVSHPISLANFYLQETASEGELYSLGDELQKATEWETIEPVVSDLVAAKFVDDGRWYRATVENIEENLIHIKFVDYGNESTCEEVKKLPVPMKSLPYFALHCTLHPIPKDADDLKEAFVDFVYSFSGIYSASFLSREIPMAVMLYCDGISIDNAIRPKLTVEVPSQSIVFTNVVVSHINSPSSFFVQAENVNLDAIADAFVDVTNFDVITQPQVGDLVAALFVDDDQWYRAKVTKVENGVNVLFVDYGNCSDATEFRELPNHAKHMPFAAKHCAFALPQGLERWPEAAKERFNELICEGNTIFEIIVIEDGDPAFVELQDHGVKIADELATLCKADIMATSREAIKSSVILSHVNNLNEMWIQTNVPQLEEMKKEMENAESFDTLESPTEGALVAAVFDDDGLWYRAKIVEVNDEKRSVLFIDYGNEGIATQLKVLPEDLVKLPPLAMRCKLKGLEVEMESQPMLTKLQDFLSEIFVLAELSKQDNDIIVDLRFKDNSIRLVEVLLATAPVTQESEKSAEPEFSIETSATETSKSGETSNEVEEPVCLVETSMTTTFKSGETSNEVEEPKTLATNTFKSGHTSNEYEVETTRVSETNDTVNELPRNSEKELESEMSFSELEDEGVGFSEISRAVETIEDTESKETMISNETEIDEVIDDKSKIERSVEDTGKCELDTVVDDLELPVENGKTDEQIVLNPTEPESFETNEVSNDTVYFDARPWERSLNCILEETDVFVDSVSSIGDSTLPTLHDDEINLFSDSATVDQPEFSNDDTVSTKFSEDLSEDYYTAYSSHVENFECDTLIADEEIPEFVLDEELSLINDESVTSTMIAPTSLQVEETETTNEKPTAEEIESKTIVHDSVQLTKIVEMDEVIDESQSKSSHLGKIEKTDETITGCCASEISIEAKNSYMAGQNESEPCTGVVDLPIVDTVADDSLEVMPNITETFSDKIEKKSSFEANGFHALIEPLELSPLSSIDDDCTEYFGSVSYDAIGEKVSLGKIDSDDEVEQVASKSDKTCHIIHVNSPSSFFIRLIDDSSRLVEMETKLREKSTTLLTGNVKVDSLVSINIEKRWRRAKVVEVNDSRGYWVKCIDYGTENYSNDLYELPAEFVTIPPFALHCGLRLSRELGCWPFEVRRKFDNIITSEANAQFVIQTIDTEEDTTFVTLMKDGVDIGEKLKLMCRDLMVEFLGGDINRMTEEDE